MKLTNHRRLASRNGGGWENESLSESFGSCWANKVQINAYYEKMKVFFDLACMSICCWRLPKPKLHFQISNGGLGSAVKLSNWDLNPCWKDKKKVFKGTLLLSLFYLYACAAELLYKHNITSVAMAVCQHTVPNPVLFPDKICAPAIHRNIQVHCKRQHTVKNEKCIWFKMTSGCVNDDRFFICVWPIAVTSITHLWQSC